MASWKANVVVPMVTAAVIATLLGGAGVPERTGTRALTQAAKGDTLTRESETARPQPAEIVKDAGDIPGPLGERPPTMVTVEMVAKELTGRLKEGVSYDYWTFDGTVPGQMIRVREGDTVEIRLTNDAKSKQSHSIDLHAVNGPHGGAHATQVAPGETKAFRFKALNPGVYVYHCATPYVPAHIANGMYGLIVVEPAGGLPPVDREYYVMQGEVYADLKPHQKGHASFDGDGLWSENPNFVVFNGRHNALTGDRQMTANVGERIRIFVGNAGPNLVSSLHVVGEIFDVVHKEGASEASTNVQTTVIPAGGAAWVEFTVDVPGDYAVIDHSINRALGKGALALLHVEGPENPEVFQAL